MATINTRFDKATLPLWARRNKAVVALAHIDLAYRCAVCAATTRHYRHVLATEAEDRLHGPEGWEGPN